MTCPTCMKSNCGNHAACARRAQAAKCPRCGRSPCRDEVRCKDVWSCWQIIGAVEYQVQYGFTPDEVASWDQVQLGTMRIATAQAMEDVMGDVLREREDADRARALAKLMLSVRR